MTDEDHKERYTVKIEDWGHHGTDIYLVDTHGGILGKKHGDLRVATFNSSVLAWEVVNLLNKDEERVNGWDAQLERAEAAEADARLLRHILEDTQYVLDMVEDKNADVMRRVRNLQIAMQQVLAAAGEAVQS